MNFDSDELILCNLTAPSSMSIFCVLFKFELCCHLMIPTLVACIYNTLDVDNCISLLEQVNLIPSRILRYDFVSVLNSH